MEISSTSDKLIDQRNSNGVTWTLCFSSFVAAIGTFQFGWNTGVINNPQSAINQFINDTLTKSSGDVSEKNIKMLTAIVVSIFAAGGLFGGLLAGWWANKFGRRNGMLVNNLVMIIAGALMLISLYVPSFEMIIIGRMLSGFGSGLYTGLVPVYLNEIAPVKIRGAIGILSQLGAVLGIFLSEVLGVTAVMGNKDYWNILLGLIMVFGIIQAICLQFCPLSPRYLLFFKKDEIAAEKALKKLRPFDYDIDSEITQIKADLCHSTDAKKLSLLGILGDKSLRMALLVGIVLHLSQQLSGINNIFYYSSTLFVSVGVAKEHSEYATLGVGFIMIVITLVSVPLIDRLGRKTLHISGLTGCLITATCFTIFYTFYIQVTGFAYLSVISALLFVAAFGIGPGSIPWIIIPELFPEGSRSTATSVGISVNWLSNLLVGLIFPSLHGALQNLIFLPFIGCHIASIIFLYFLMPETKGLTTEESSKLFKGLKTCSQKIDERLEEDDM